MLAVCGIVRQKGRILMCRRTTDVLFPGFWELPTEFLDNEETLDEALERALFERLTVKTQSMRPWGAVNYSYGAGYRIVGYEVKLCRNFVHLYGYDDFRWVKPKKLKRLRVLPPHVMLLTGLNHSL